MWQNDCPPASAGRAPASKLLNPADSESAKATLNPFTVRSEAWNLRQAFQVCFQQEACCHHQRTLKCPRNSMKSGGHKTSLWRRTNKMLSASEREHFNATDIVQTFCRVSLRRISLGTNCHWEPPSFRRTFWCTCYSKHQRDAAYICSIYSHYAIWYCTVLLSYASLGFAPSCTPFRLSAMKVSCPPWLLATLQNAKQYMSKCLKHPETSWNSVSWEKM